jgi:hypothetical protein
MPRHIRPLAYSAAMPISGMYLNSQENDELLKAN